MVAAVSQGHPKQVMDAAISAIVQRETGQQTTPLTVRCALCPTWSFTGEPEDATRVQTEHRTVAHPEQGRRLSAAERKTKAITESRRRRDQQDAERRAVRTPRPLSEGEPDATESGAPAAQPVSPSLQADQTAPIRVGPVALTTGSSPSPNGKRAPKPSGYWTRDRIIEAIRRHAADNDGYGPPSTLWLARAPEDCPNAQTVVRRFGAWSAAIKAAGVKPPVRGPRHAPVEPTSATAEGAGSIPAPNAALALAHVFSRLRAQIDSLEREFAHHLNGGQA